MARVAFIIDEMFEDSEDRVPFDRLRQAGHEITIVGIERGKTVTGKKGQERVTLQMSAREARADDFDALVIPGGYSPDKLRVSREMVSFTSRFFQQEKTVAAVCHGGWMLVEADACEG